MSISQIAKSLTPSATLKLNEKAAILRQKGNPVIHLGGGEPISQPSVFAINALQDLLKSGEIRYTPAGGTSQIKKAIVQYTHDYYQKEVHNNNIIATIGAKQALVLALQSIINPKDEVVFPAPYWVSYPEMVKICGGIPKSMIPANNVYHPVIADIENVVTSKTKTIIINSPNNPSGAVYTEQFIEDIIAYCEKQDIYLIMDDIYQRLIYDGKTPISSYKYVTKSIEDSKLIVINGVSKQYAMTGFRLGWAVANSKLIKVMSKFQAHQTTAPSILSDKAAVAALTNDQSCVENLRSALEIKRDALVSGLRKINGVKVFKSEGTFYCFADFSVYSKNSAELAEYLIDTAQVITVPGIAFGLDGFLRISFCRDIDEIEEGVHRIKNALSNKNI